METNFCYSSIGNSSFVKRICSIQRETKGRIHSSHTKWVARNEVVTTAQSLTRP